MRENKFQGKRLDNGEWIVGSEIFIHDEDGVWLECPDTLDVVLVDPATVGQFIGLTDNKGEETYEGDIVEWKNMMGTNMYSAIAYLDHGFCFVDANNEPQGIWCHSFTKIGNIHDNPELLK